MAMPLLTAQGPAKISNLLESILFVHSSITRLKYTRSPPESERRDGRRRTNCCQSPSASQQPALFPGNNRVLAPPPFRRPSIVTNFRNPKAHDGVRRDRLAGYQRACAPTSCCQQAQLTQGTATILLLQNQAVRPQSSRLVPEETG